MNRLDAFLNMLQPGQGHWAIREVGVDAPYEVTPSDAIAMLEAFRQASVSYEQLLDWANQKQRGRTSGA